MITARTITNSAPLIQGHELRVFRTRIGLVQLEAVMPLLGLSEDRVGDLILEGHLAAFNLAADRSRSRVCFPCVWWPSLVSYASLADKNTLATYVPTETILARLLPATRETLGRGEVMDLLQIKTCLFNRHVRAGRLRQKGAGGPITVKSIESLLRMRRIS